MTFVNGESQAQFMTWIRGLDPHRCLVIPVDVGKSIAMALVADHYGEIIVAPFEFALTEAGLEVVELNPRAVKDARGQQLLRALKDDPRDCGAMAELLIRGTGRPPQCRDEALAAQAMLANQIHSQLDLIFPGLTGCFSHGLDAASLRVLIRDLPDPDRVRRLGTDGVLRYVRRRGVRMTRPKAEQVVAAAQVVLRLPATERSAPLVVLAAPGSESLARIVGDR